MINEYQDSSTNQVIAYCKSSYYSNTNEGTITIAFDRPGKERRACQCSFKPVSSIDFVSHLAILVALEYMNKYDFKGIVFSPSLGAISQIRGNFRVNVENFWPLINSTRAQIKDDLSVEYKHSREIKISKRLTCYSVDEEILSKVKKLINRH